MLARTSPLLVLPLLIAPPVAAQDPPPPAPRPAPKTRLSGELQKLAASTTIVVGHRGAAATHPENTLPSFAEAVRAGAPVVELDFYQSTDGVLVCFHDKTLDRTTDSVARLGGKKLKITDYDLAALQELDAGRWKDARFAGTRIPTLESALKVIQRGSMTMIEHKHGDPAVLVALLRRMELVDAVLVQSFDWKFLRAVHRLEPRLTVAALGGSKEQPRPTDRVLLDLQETGASMVHWSFKRLQPVDVGRLHELGYLVCVYTVNAPEDFDRAIAMGVDAITTDVPARLRAHLAARKKAAEDPKGPGR